jgi:hypothetical protein|tara:strand:+ start:1038 stop:1226 length:189 start_codon:yes stop_codon:yes gene_type:complete
MKMKKYCSRCGKQIDFLEEASIGYLTYYLQIFQRGSRGNRDNTFLCKECCDKFIKFMNNNEI